MVTALSLCVLGSADLRAETCATAKCHKKYRGKKLHGKLGKGKCTSCHKPQKKLKAGKEHGKKAFELNEPHANTCYGCHKKAKKKHVFKNVHGPLAVGSCVQCHSPHGDVKKKLLVSTGVKLCYRCHEASRFKGKVTHTALDDGCTSCHAPHGGDTPNFVRSSTTTLCQKCHKVSSHKNKLALSKSCLTCHDPHRSQRANLLKGSRQKVGKRCKRSSQATAKPRSDSGKTGNPHS